MADIQEIVDRYLATFNGADAERRQGAGRTRLPRRDIRLLTQAVPVTDGHSGPSAGDWPHARAGELT
jgi:hypothetical protein